MNMLQKYLLVLFLFFMGAAVFASVEDLSVNAHSIVLKNVAENDSYHGSFYNPALNVFAKDNYIISASYVPMEYEENIRQVMGSFPLYQGNAELSYSQFVSKGVEIWNDDNVFLGKSEYKQDLLGILYSQKIIPYNSSLPLDFGLRLNIEEARVGSDKVYASNSLDLGVNAVFGKDLAVGLSLLNFGDDENYNFAFGINKKYWVDWYFNFYSSDEISFAFESDISENFNIYAGVDNDLIDPYMDFMSGIKLGFSLEINGRRIDYAFSKRGELGYLHYLTLSFFMNKTEYKTKKNQEKKKGLAETRAHQNYKVVVSEYTGHSQMRPLILKYLRYENKLNILDDSNYQKVDIYKSTDTLKAHLVLSFDLYDLGVGDSFMLELDVYDVYLDNTVKVYKKEFFSIKKLELNMRNLIFVFLDNYKTMIEDGVLKKEEIRIKKILDAIKQSEILLDKKKQKDERVKEFELQRKMRILVVKQKQKIEKIKSFEEDRWDRIRQRNTKVVIVARVMT
ncbi:MAG: hypothetical protein GY817_01835 [bacterium]|nr:hypothetical protein [bacterium]